ncbi:Rrf2 family transcriptional regulator [Oenococcus alcoholitolerans]|uniref:Rrf2 family transcriptional regulator n=1 Tax=Oenococcus alcoholitolerans TaxID=931074 RepID=UPI003F716DC8
MKYSHKLSDAIHVLTYIDIFKDGDLSSSAIANSIESNPSLVRRSMAQLTKKGLLVSQPGTVRVKLARPSDEISLLDIYQAIDEVHELLHVDPQTNLDCPVGRNIQPVLRDFYDQIQKAAEQKMAAIKLSDISRDILVCNQKNV